MLKRKDKTILQSDIRVPCPKSLSANYKQNLSHNSFFVACTFRAILRIVSLQSMCSNYMMMVQQQRSWRRTLQLPITGCYLLVCVTSLALMPRQYQPFVELGHVLGYHLAMALSMHSSDSNT